MMSFLSNRRARRRWITYTVLLVTTLLLMAFSSNPGVREVQRGINFAFKPVQAAFASVAENVASVVGAITEIDRLRIDNAALHEANDRLANENKRLDLLRQENDQLTGLLQLQNGFDHQTVAARVIGRETLPTIRMVALDKGTDDGLALGDVVIVQGGALAGRITDIGPTFAKVTLLSDASSVVIGQLSLATATGEIRGEAGGVLVMQNIDASVAISLDEEVYTAGLELAGGIRSPYPRGLVIGSVVDVQRDATDVVQTAFIQPAANLSGFSLVLVITDYTGGLPLVDPSPSPNPSGAGASAAPSTAP
jgi:rod shape-determining protein MreC